MRKIGVICLSALLVSWTVRAQSAAEYPGIRVLATSSLRAAVEETLRPDGTTSSQSARLTAPPQRRTKDEAHRRNRAALIGLGIGVGAAMLYWNASSCRTGSDSQQVLVAYCMIPAGAMIGTGFFVGRAIGTP